MKILLRGTSCLRVLGPLATAALMLGGPAALAQDRADNTHNPVVVELFTSQGCSSCPPADQILKKVASRDDVIALALHVDYWDYIGWKDSFGQAKFTKRQKLYAKAAGERSIYTPQMVVNGKDHIVGAHEMDLMEQIARHAAAGHPVRLSLLRNGEVVEISAEIADGARVGGAALDVQLVRYLPEQTVAIGRGENTGRTVEYVNIVTSWERIAEWQGDAPLKMQISAPGAEPVVVIVQKADHGEIVAAASLR
ncbi:MAG: DUF1223 domain-containing protein [Paracoccaceae bacterium]